MIPTGKGLFARFVLARDVDHLVERCQYAGIEWLAVLVLWQYGHKRSRFGVDPTPIARRLVDAGIQPIPWAYSVPGKTRELVRVLMTSAAKMGAPASIVDAEREWRGKPAPPLVAALLALQVGGRSVGLTSYGAPWNHRTFPWRAAAIADFVMPQIYEMAPMPKGYPARSVEAYQAHGAKVVVPISSAMKRPAAMQELLSRTPTPDDAIAWWDVVNADASPRRWSVLRDYEVAA